MSPFTHQFAVDHLHSCPQKVKSVCDVCEEAAGVWLENPQVHMCIRSAQILAKYNMRMNVKHLGSTCWSTVLRAQTLYKVLDIFLQDTKEHNKSDKGVITLDRIDSTNACIDKHLHMLSTWEGFDDWTNETSIWKWEFLGWLRSILWHRVAPRSDESEKLVT